MKLYVVLCELDGKPIRTFRNKEEAEHFARGRKVLVTDDGIGKRVSPKLKFKEMLTDLGEALM